MSSREEITINNKAFKNFDNALNSAGFYGNLSAKKRILPPKSIIFHYADGKSTFIPYASGITKDGSEINIGTYNNKMGQVILYPIHDRNISSEYFRDYLVPLTASGIPNVIYLPRWFTHRQILVTVFMY